MRHQCWRRLSLLAILVGLLQGLDAQKVPGPTLPSQTLSILGDELYLHGGSAPSALAESNCTSELWRLRLGHTSTWNLSSVTWESVPLREDTSTLPPLAGLGLRSLTIPANNSLALVNGTSTAAQNNSPYMIEFGRAGCADGHETTTNDQGEVPQPWIGFNIYNPVMNTWESIDLVNATTDLGFDASSALTTGDWHSPTVAVDNVNFAWYIILQSTTPLRQVILKKDLVSLTDFASRTDLTKIHSTLFPTDLLYEEWTETSTLNELAPFVGDGVATVVRGNIVIISGTANSFTPGDADTSQLRGCNHAYIFSTTTNNWSRQDLTVANGDAMPETRESAAILAVGSKIYMHGGVKPYQQVLSDLWILDTDTWTWTRGPDGSGPRAGHTLLQYHEYLLAVSGYNVARSAPSLDVLPLMAYDTNATMWTDVMRPTVNAETSFITNVTRVAIITGTVMFGLVLLVLGTSTHLLRKWNQRNYHKVAENFELDEQRRKAAQSLPSILKKSYLGSDSADDSAGARWQNGQKGGAGGGRGGGRLQSEVIFEDVEGEYEIGEDEDAMGQYHDDSGDSYDEDEGNDHDRQHRRLLSRAQPDPKSRPPRRVRIEERVNVREDEVDTRRRGGAGTDDEDEEGPVIVQMPSDL
ncbi:hypothetical protein BGZ98_005699 [Dissophora globulifera]|nr:hypothetical protein BGZ98_005699 [Dissophora globulifera]